VAFPGSHAGLEPGFISHFRHNSGKAQFASAFCVLPGAAEVTLSITMPRGKKMIDIEKQGVMLIYGGVCTSE